MHKAPTRHNKIGVRVASLNVGMMHGRAGEIVETAAEHWMYSMLCAKNKGKGGAARMVTGTNSFG